MISEEIIVSASTIPGTRPIPDTDRFKPCHRAGYSQKNLPGAKSDASSKQTSASRAGEQSFLSVKLSHMVALMRNTLEIRDRSFGAKMYSTCFSAASAIDWLLINGYVDSRIEGQHLCQELLDSQVLTALTKVDGQLTVSLICSTEV